MLALTLGSARSRAIASTDGDTSVGSGGALGGGVTWDAAPSTRTPPVVAHPDSTRQHVTTTARTLRTHPLCPVPLRRPLRCYRPAGQSSGGCYTTVGVLPKSTPNVEVEEIRQGSNHMFTRPRPFRYVTLAAFALLVAAVVPVVPGTPPPVVPPERVTPPTVRPGEPRPAPKIGPAKLVYKVDTTDPVVFLTI